MQNPLHRILSITLLAIMCMILLGAISNRGHRLYYKPFYEKLDETFNGSTYYEVLLMGNSKVQFGVHPKVVDSVAKTNSYNLGYAAGSFVTMEMLLKAYLSKHKAPATIVLCLQESLFCNVDDNCNSFIFYNYLQSAHARNYLKAMNKPYYLATAIPYSKFLYFDDYNRGNIISGLVGKSDYYNNNMENYKGYTMNKSTFKPKLFNNILMPVADTINNKALTSFHHIMELCVTNNIQVILAWSPSASVNGLTNTLAACLDSNYTPRYQYIMRNYNTTEFQPHEFIDGGHMNYLGTLHYSAVLGKLIDSLHHKQLSMQ